MEFDAYICLQRDLSSLSRQAPTSPQLLLTDPFRTDFTLSLIISSSDGPRVPYSTFLEPLAVCCARLSHGASELDGVRGQRSDSFGPVATTTTAHSAWWQNSQAKRTANSSTY